MVERRPAYRLARVIPAVAGIVLFGLGFVGAERVLALRTRPGSGDIALFEAVVSKVAAGAPYYTVLAEELPSRGYPVRPVFAWRLPTLSWLLASVPTLAVAQGLLWAIAALTIWAWARVIGLRAGAIALVLTAPLPLLFSSAAVYMYELWAGQLIALGLSLWMVGHSRAALIALVAASLIREHALLALGLVVVASWRQNRSRTLAGVSMVSVVAAYGAHVAAALRHTPTEGITNGWGGLLGWAFVVSAMKGHVLLIAAPYWAAALAAAVCMPSLWLWREGRLVAIIVTAYAAVFCVAARPDNWYWGMLILPLMPLGCIALAHEALSRRPTSSGGASATIPSA